MNNYDFKTKQMTNLLDSIEYVVNNCDDICIPMTKQDAVIVELFDKLFIGVPVERLGTINLISWTSEYTGTFMRGYRKISFSIHNNILYLRKRY